MYRKKNREKQVEEVKIILEKQVPENHILRTIDFSFIYDYVRRFAATDISCLKQKKRGKLMPLPFSSTRPIKQYQLELEEEINELRLADGKKKLLPPSLKK